MQQHPVPQNIATYQFRLVGDMTLKQFLEILAGIVAAALFYYTNLFGPIKWVLIITCVLIGFALAFFPIEERPLDQWFFAYIRAIYAPTLFIWRKTVHAPPYFAFVAHSTPLTQDTQELMKAQVQRKKAGLSTFLMTIPQHQQNDWEVQESTNLQRVLGLFAAPAPPAPRSFSPLPLMTPPLTGANWNRPPRRTVAVPPLPISPPTTVKIVVPHIAPLPPRPIPLVTEVKTAPPIHRPTNVVAPQSTPIKIEPSLKTNPMPIVVPVITGTKLGPPIPTSIVTNRPAAPAAPTITDNMLPFPTAPTTPNTVVGMVLDSQGKIIDNAIIEIRDHNGVPVRATKTNRLGQFFSTTPLKDGDYEVETEAPNRTFTITQLKLTGKVVDPLKIQATA